MNNKIAVNPHVYQADILPRARFFRNWEYARHHRVHALIECVAEFVGVFFYVWFGVGSTASFILTNLGKQPGLGSLFQVGFGYMFGIVAGLSVAAATSGGHINPCVTIVFAMYRGFPWRKVPQYIIFQILGAYVACLCVYLAYKDVIIQLEEGLAAAGQTAAVMFTPNGPAGIFALYPNPGKPLGLIFWNEFVIDFVLGITIWAGLDPSNFFVPPAAAPWVIGAAYAGAIWGFSPANMAANSARDIGGRLMALTIWGKQAGGGSYAAIAALTNILATILAVTFYEFFMMDSSRVLPAAQRDFLSGHQAHLHRKQGASRDDYVSGKESMEHQESGSSAAEDKAAVNMRD